MSDKIKQRKKRQTRVRSKIFGTRNRPRLSVHRSNRYISAQIIDDEKRQTLVGQTSRSLTDKKIPPLEKARLLGEQIAKMATQKKIKKVVFDRGPYRFHGQVKALAEGARKGGLEF